MSELSKRAEKRRQEMQKDVDQMIEDTIRQSWAANTIAWVAVVGGAFVLNLLVLLLLSGG